MYLRRPPVGRNHTWEMDHKLLPILVRPPRGPAVCPWLTSIRMGMVADAARGPFGAVPAAVRIDRGLEFAAAAVTDAFATLCVDPHRLPAFQPHRKPQVRVLLLWGRQPADMTRLHSDVGLEQLGRSRTLLSGY